MNTRPERLDLYSVHDSKTGSVLMSSISLDSDEVESLSTDTQDGFFDACECSGLEQFGSRSVYAILL